MQVEQKRRDKEIRQGMDATVRITLHPDSELSKLLSAQENLHLTFNVSSVELCSGSNQQPEISVAKSSKQKCERCWLFLADDTQSICPVSIQLQQTQTNKPNSVAPQSSRTNLLINPHGIMRFIDVKAKQRKAH